MCNNGIYGVSDESILYDGKISKTIEKKYKNSCVLVINEDVLVVAEKYNISEKDSHILVLNMASYYKPGGGVLNRAMAQEEELFRRSNYFMSLNKPFYPLPKTNIILTNNVTIFKNKYYEYMKTPFTVSMIAAAAIKNPKLIPHQKSSSLIYSNYDFDIMFCTIGNIFRIAHINNFNTLILGALGCGAYNNPPLEVIKIFNHYINLYNGCFKNIIFAVYSKNDNNFNLFNDHIFRAT